MDGIRSRVRVPKTAAPNEAFTIKVMISHPMESGERRDADGNTIPRHIINRFAAAFEGETVIDVTMEPAISNNPFFEFRAAVPHSGTFTFTWHDDDGDVYTNEAAIEIA